MNEVCIDVKIRKFFFYFHSSYNSFREWIASADPFFQVISQIKLSDHSELQTLEIINDKILTLVRGKPGKDYSRWYRQLGEIYPRMYTSEHLPVESNLVTSINCSVKGNIKST